MTIFTRNVLKRSFFPRDFEGTRTLKIFEKQFSRRSFRNNFVSEVRAGFWQNRFFADIYFWAAGFIIADFVTGFFSSFLWGKVPRKILQENPRQTPPKFIQQKSPTHFCRGAGPTEGTAKSSRTWKCNDCGWNGKPARIKYRVTGNVYITVIIFLGINFGITLHSLYRKCFLAKIILLYITLSRPQPLSCTSLWFSLHYIKNPDAN